MTLSALYAFPRVAPLAGSVDRNFAEAEEKTEAVKSLPSRGAWIEISMWTATPSSLKPSLPSRGAWIEMRRGLFAFAAACVAPLAGSVDRNYFQPGGAAAPGWVAPLAGSVDRNYGSNARFYYQRRSLPSRGAWIEI